MNIHKRILFAARKWNSLIKIVIAEDEALEMEAMKNDVDYSSLGMEVAGTAYNGKNALELVKRILPDILITDIVMPKLSGLELAKRAKELRPDISIVLISGHQRFDYARQGIEYGVDGFLIKPLFPEHLYATLQEIAKKIQQRNRRRFDEEVYAEELRANLPVLRELFIGSVMTGALPEDVQKRFDYYGITLTDSSLSAMCLLPEEKSDASMLSLRRCVSSFFGAMDRNHCFAILSRIQNEPLCVLFQCGAEDGSSTLFDLAEQLRISILNDSGLAVTIGLGSCASGWKGIAECVTHAQRALEYRFYIGSGQVISFQDISSAVHYGSPNSLRSLFVPLLDAADRGDEDEVERLCAEMKREASGFNLSPESMRLLFSELVSRIFFSRYELGLGANDFCEAINADTLDGLIEHIKNELLSKNQSTGRYIAGREQWLVQRIKEEIGSHYAENPTIDDIAERIYISAGYAAKLFRKHTGESINSYMIRIRIQAAADILTDPSVNINEAAARTGYTNISYFSSVFRKHFNCTPREWRDLHAGKTGEQ